MGEKKLESLIGRRVVYLPTEKIIEIAAYFTDGLAYDEEGNSYDIHCVGDQSEDSFALKDFRLLPVGDIIYSIF